MLRWEWSEPEIKNAKLVKKWEQILLFPNSDPTVIIIEPQSRQLDPDGRKDTV